MQFSPEQLISPLRATCPYTSTRIPASGRISFALIVIFLVFAGTTADAGDCQTGFTVAYHEYTPYSFFSDEGELKGSDIAYVTKILDSLSCKYRFVPMSWDKTLVEIDGGRIDLSMYASHTPDRARKYLYSIPYRHETGVYAIKKGAPDRLRIQTLQEIAARGIVVGTDYFSERGPEFTDLLTKYPQNFRHIAETRPMLRMMLSGRVDAIIDYEQAVKYELIPLKQQDSVELLFLDFEKDPIHMIFNRKTVNPDLVKKVNRFIKEHPYEIVGTQ